MTTRYIFITGGVLSSLGKGIASASIAALLQAQGYKVKIKKLDPYINYDPGTMNPYEHGEVYVTRDGAETDLDLGHYERFTGIPSTKNDNTTAGKIYFEVIQKERAGDYLGKTVMVIPHITDKIKSFIRADTENYDFVLCELGGTIGDIEGLPFVEAIRQFGNDLGRDLCCFVHLTLLPYIKTAGEFKTKPSQRSVKDLLSLGIQPDFLLCRGEVPLPDEARSKLSLYCNLPKARVFNAIDVPSIYMVPDVLQKEGLDQEIVKFFRLPYNVPDMEKWQPYVAAIDDDSPLKIGMIVKYEKLKDAYKSLVESLVHASYAVKKKVEIVWIGSEELEEGEGNLEIMRVLDAIIVPGGFGARGTEGKISALRFARENKVPCLGICLGMQLMVIEYARTVLGWHDANSTEQISDCKPVVSLITEWDKDGLKESRSEEGNMGGTMRLGAYPCHIKADSLLHHIYQKDIVHERHRHRYEVSAKYRKDFEGAGLNFSGMSPDQRLTEVVEVKEHPWMIGVQYHPEYESWVGSPNPLFKSFLEAALNYKEGKNEKN